MPRSSGKHVANFTWRTGVSQMCHTDFKEGWCKSLASYRAPPHCTLTKKQIGLDHNNTCALPLSAAVCQVYTAVNTLAVSAELLVETYLPFLAVTNSSTHPELRLPCEAHESDGWKFSYPRARGWIKLKATVYSPCVSSQNQVCLQLI